MNPLESMRTKRNVFLWASYDFANSLVSIVFFLYFAQWIVVEQGIADLTFNLAFTVSALLLLVTVPFTGVVLDRSLRRISGLRLTTIGCAIFYGLCAFVATQGNGIFALILFTIGLYLYLLSFTFYTPLINDISSEKKRGRVSGLGIMANYFGQFTGLLIALPFSRGILSLFGGSARAETLFPAVIAFFVFSLPMLVFFREPHRVAQKISFVSKVKEIGIQTRSLFGTSGVALFLVAFFLFNDAILTASNNFSIFLEQVWHVSDTIKTFILLGVVITSALGGLGAGFIADRFGHKRTLAVILAGWMVLLPLIGFVTHFGMFVVLSVLMGFWFGASWASARSVMAYVAPSGKHNLAFGYYGLAERASSLLGPIVWGVIVSSLVDLGSVRYRIAVAAVSVFVLLGLIVLSRVRSDRAAIAKPL